MSKDKTMSISILDYNRIKSGQITADDIEKYGKKKLMEIRYGLNMENEDIIERIEGDIKHAPLKDKIFSIKSQKK